MSKDNVPGTDGLAPEVKMEAINMEIDATTGALEKALQELEELARRDLTTEEIAREGLLRGLVRFYR